LGWASLNLIIMNKLENLKELELSTVQLEKTEGGINPNANYRAFITRTGVKNGGRPFYDASEPGDDGFGVISLN
jgi:hypothetical protein